MPASAPCPAGGAAPSSCVPPVRMLSGSCQETVRKPSGKCQEAVRELSGKCQDAVRKLSGSCQEAVRMLSGSCQEAVRKLSGSAIRRRCDMEDTAFAWQILACGRIFSLPRCIGQRVNWASGKRPGQEKYQMFYC